EEVIIGEVGHRLGNDEASCAKPVAPGVPQGLGNRDAPILPVNLAEQPPPVGRTTMLAINDHLDLDTAPLSRSQTTPVTTACQEPEDGGEHGCGGGGHQGRATAPTAATTSRSTRMDREAARGPARLGPEEARSFREVPACPAVASSGCLLLEISHVDVVPVQAACRETERSLEIVHHDLRTVDQPLGS